MTTRIYTAEFLQEKKVIVQAFTTKTAAVAWARERIADERVSTIAIWECSANASAHGALVVAAEGKQWYDARRTVAIIARKGARIMR